MSVSPAEGLYDVAEAAGLLGVGPWVGQIGKLAPEGDAIVAFIGHPGRQPEVGVAIDYPAVQLIGRHPLYSVGYAKMIALRDLLHGIPQNPAAYPELTSCVARGGIADMGRDDKDRAMFSLNFNLIVTPVATGHRS